MSRSNKPTIAVDVDDVLAHHVEAFVTYSNTNWGTDLTAKDYDENWETMWRVDRQELDRRAEQYYLSGIMSRYRVREDAAAVLARLRHDFHLIVITSRVLRVEVETLAWINHHFPDMFDAIHFAGMWDTDEATESRVTRTKAALCQSLGADYLIDDQLKHCTGAAECGVKSLLFGNYHWNRQAPLADGITRVADWDAVKEYFDGQIV